MSWLYFQSIVFLKILLIGSRAIFKFAERTRPVKNVRFCCSNYFGTKGYCLAHRDNLTLIKSSNILTGANLLRANLLPDSTLIRFNHGASQRIEKFILPDIGEGINEVVIKDWQIKIGDLVREFDGICEVESDKATATISSRYEGTIVKIHYQIGEMAKVGTPLVDILLSNSSAVQSDTVDQQVSLGGDKNSGNPSRDDSALASSQQVATLPSVRRLAAEKGVDLNRVKPTGRNGRILKEDLLAYLESSQAALNTQSEEPQIQVAIQQLDTANEVVKIPLKGIRKAMFKTMTQSVKIPHFNYSDEIDLSRLVRFSERQKASSTENRIGSFAFIIKMVSLALLEYPQLNASIDESGDHLIEKHYHNIGVAVDTKNGLIVPNIKNVQQFSVAQINLELKRLRELGYSSKLSPSDLSGGTFTLSNIGAIGGIFGVPVIVEPEIVIGALGRTRKLPRFNSAGAIEEQNIMQIVWSADHRVVDGATLSRFSNLLKNYLEEPELSLSKLA